MAIYVEEIGITADMRDDVLVPDFGQQRATGLLQLPILPFLPSQAGGISR
jgi:hypothetical protein